MSINDNIKFLEDLKIGFKRTTSWNKHRSEITIKPKNNSLDYLIDPTYMNINRLFALSLKMLMTILQKNLLMSLHEISRNPRF